MLFFLAALKYNIRNFFFFLCFAVIFAVSCVQASSNSTANTSTIPANQDRLNQLMSATVGFVIEDNGKVNSVPYCTGFFVNNDVIATAAHCFLSSVNIEINGREHRIRSSEDIVSQKVNFIFKREYDSSVRLSDIDAHFGTIIAVDLEHDLVLVISHERSTNFIRLASQPPGIGEKVYAIGHPRGLGWTFSEGIVSRSLIQNGHIMIIQATTLLSGGCSGGPLLNAHGEVIAVADAFINNLPHLGIFIGNHYIKEMLNAQARRSVPDAGRNF